ncbi:MAG: type I glyceraldehyde-3-phosphate dehydrogenase [Candidatus Cloacimonetes bacterium]|nr:type I glyceraldehyde-3-phosphate dehydrogenase [Candidatus Cloacimonadota bacterium]
MTIKVAINGFGRIGRCFFRQVHKLGTEVEIVAINDLTDAKTLAHLLKYDSVHGRFSGNVSVDGNALIVDGKPIRITAEKNPENLGWKALEVDLVVESTGVFKDKAEVSRHIKAGAKKVIVSAPLADPDITIVMGVNEKSYDKTRHDVISNASCTTNCLAPIAKVIDANLGIESGLMTTIHSYTNDQRILDLPHSDLRRARAAALNMIPTKTGAAKAVAEVLPQLKGKLTGIAVRVPTPNVSVVDVCFVTKKQTSAEAVNAMLNEAALKDLKGILEVCDEELVSGDFNGSSFSSSVDAKNTMVQNGNLVKVLSWYDNEMGYSTRIVDLIRHMFA